MTALTHGMWLWQLVPFILTVLASPAVAVFTVRQFYRWRGWAGAYHTEYRVARGFVTYFAAFLGMLYWPSVWGALLVYYCGVGVYWMLTRFYPWLEERVSALEDRKRQKKERRRAQAELARRAAQSSDDWLKQRLRTLQLEWEAHVRGQEDAPSTCGLCSEPVAASELATDSDDLKVSVCKSCMSEIGGAIK